MAGEHHAVEFWTGLHIGLKLDAQIKTRPLPWQPTDPAAK